MTTTSKPQPCQENHKISSTTATTRDHQAQTDPPSPGPQPPLAPDGGYGWMVVVAATLSGAVVEGTIVGFGILLPVVKDHFQLDYCTTVLVVAVQIAAYFASGPLAIWLVKLVGCRAVAMTGGLLTSAGMWTAMFSPSVTIFIMLYGLVGGIGMGLAILPCTVMTSFYFNEKRALAVGISYSGSSLGILLVVPILVYLIKEEGWEYTLITISAICLHLILFGALLRPLISMKGRKGSKGITDGCLDKNSDEDGILNQGNGSVGWQFTDIPYADAYSRSCVCIPETIKESPEPTEKGTERCSQGVEKYPSQECDYMKSVDSNLNNNAVDDGCSSTSSFNYALREVPNGIANIHEYEIIDDKPKPHDVTMSCDLFALQKEAQNGKSSHTGRNRLQSVPKLTVSCHNISTPPRIHHTISIPIDAHLAHGGDTFYVESIDDEVFQSQNDIASGSVSTVAQVPTSDAISRDTIKTEETLVTQTSHSREVLAEKKQEELPRGCSKDRSSDDGIFISAASRSISKESDISRNILNRTSCSDTNAKSKSKQYIRSFQIPGTKLHELQCFPNDCALPECKRASKTAEYLYDQTVQTCNPLDREDIFYTSSLQNIKKYQECDHLLTYISKSTATRTIANHSEIKNCCLTSMSIFSDLSVFQNPHFLVLCIGNTFLYLGYYIPLIFLGAHVRTLHLSDWFIVALLAIFGLFNCLGRMISGISLTLCKPLHLNNISIIASGIIAGTIIFNNFLNTETLHVVYAVSLGFFMGGSFPMTPVLVEEYVGLEHLSYCTGILFLVKGISSGVGMALAGWILDASGSSNYIFILVAALFIISGLTHYILPLLPTPNKSKVKH